MPMFADKTILEAREEKNFIQAINEAYFGRTPGITRVYNAFCDFRNKYVSSNPLRGIDIKNVNAQSDKDLQRFVSEAERQFGFESFSFEVINDLQQNMGTYPILIKLPKNPKKMVYIDKEGYHFKKEAGMSLIMISYAQMLFNDKYTDEEMFAVVLHEIGHNFQVYMNKQMFALDMVSSTLEIINIIIDSVLHNDLIFGMIQMTMLEKNFHNVFAKIFKQLHFSDDLLSKAYRYFEWISGTLRGVTSAIQSISLIPLAPMLLISTGFINLLKNIILLPNTIYNYAGEISADNFPTYYGFGKSSITAQEKFKNISVLGMFGDAINSIPIIGHLYNLSLLPGMILIELSDGHPPAMTRCKSMLNSMRRDLNDPNLSPKLKSELKKQIDETEKQVDEYLDEITKLSNTNTVKNNIDKIAYEHDLDLKYKAIQKILCIDKLSLEYSNTLREEYDYLNESKKKNENQHYEERKKGIFYTREKGVDGETVWYKYNGPFKKAELTKKEEEYFIKYKLPFLSYETGSDGKEIWYELKVPFHTFSGKSIKENYIMNTKII